jgi:D-alanyl-D-alanine carboxypeptidase
VIRPRVRTPLAGVLSLASLLAALLAMPGGAGGAAARPEAVVPALQQALDRYLAARSAVEHVSAASLSVSIRGAPSTVNVTAGRTQWDGTEPVSPDAVFQIGSNTKAFTAVILLQLEAEGKLSLDDTLGKWLPQYPAWKDVSIRRLLNMTARIPSYDDTPYFIRALGSGPDTTWTAPELVAIVYPKIGPPPPDGPGWIYSNTNYVLAQMIIERATGDSYADELTSRLITPLGLRSTFYGTSRYPPQVTARLVAGYYFNTDPELDPARPLVGRDVSAWSASWAQGAGGIVSTTEDLARWVRALYEGPVLAPAQREEMLSIVSTATGAPIAKTTLRNPRGFGLAVGQLTTATTGTLWFYEGETLGYRALYAYAPARGTIIAVALNSQPTSDGIGELMKTVYGILHRAGWD